jgi:hypothetical protein
MTTNKGDERHNGGRPDPKGGESPRTDAELLNDFLQAYMANIEQQIEQAKRTLAVEVIPALLACGVANVEVAYSGYGDSGAIDGVQYRDAAGLRVVRDNIPQGVREKLETCVYGFLPSGFEINDGGQGTITIDLPTRKITLQHGQNEVVSHDTVREWEV